MSEIKDLEFGQEARAKMMIGVKKLAKAVKSTLGPRGRNIVIQKRHGAPHITKDGVSVAREVFLKDPFEDMGAQILKQAASRTADVSGDGTTSSTVLAEAILVDGMRLIAADHDPMSLKRGIDKATLKLVEALKAQSREVKDTNEIRQIATISANGDAEIGNMIADAVDKVGKFGVITLEEGKNNRETTIRTTTGFEFDRGYLHDMFCNDTEKQRVVLENTTVPADGVKVWLINGTLSSSAQMQDILPTLEQLHTKNMPLLIVADNLEGEVLATLVVNKMRGALNVCAVRAPGFGATKHQLMADLAVITGAHLRDPSAGDELVLKTTFEELGTAKQVVVTKETTVIVGMEGREEAIEQRATEIRAVLTQETSTWDRDRTEKRLAKLLGGVAVIRVGAASEIEMKERKDRFEDALAAVRATVAEGVVVGGGLALVRSAQAVKDFTTGNTEEDAGVKILLNAATAPLKQIATNAGQNGDMVLKQVQAEKDPHVGYNAATQVLQNLMTAGILDPTKVVRISLENAVSVAGTMLTVEGAMAYEPEKVDNNKK